MAVIKATTRVEFGEAMENDHRSAWKRFWQLVRHLSGGRQQLASTVYIGEVVEIRPGTHYVLAILRKAGQGDNSETIQRHQHRRTERIGTLSVNHSSKMWKRSKNTGHRVQSFSLVHRYIQHFNEVSGNKSAIIRKRSKIPGVVIIQHVANLPEGKSTPDFQCKPMPVTTQEGKVAVFKAVVKGDPKPVVSWKRTKGTLSDKDKFQSKYDKSTGEHILEIHRVSGMEADIYKCYAVNQYGKAVCSAALTITDSLATPSDFRKLLRSTKGSKMEENQTLSGDEETTQRFWDIMMNADRKDYERIFAEFGVTNNDLILKTLEEKRAAKQMCKNGMTPYEESGNECGLKTGGSTMDIGVSGLMQKDKGMNHMNAENINLFLMEFKDLNEAKIDSTDDDESSPEQLKHSSHPNQSQPQDAVNDKRSKSGTQHGDLNEAKIDSTDDDESSPEQIERSSHPNQSQPQDAVNDKRSKSGTQHGDLNEAKIDSTDDDESSPEQIERSSLPNLSQPQDAVNDKRSKSGTQHGIFDPNEAKIDSTDDDESSPEQLKHSSLPNQSQPQDAVNDKRSKSGTQHGIFDLNEAKIDSTDDDESSPEQLKRSSHPNQSQPQDAVNDKRSKSGTQHGDLNEAKIDSTDDDESSPEQIERSSHPNQSQPQDAVNDKRSKSGTQHGGESTCPQKHNKYDDTEDKDVAAICVEGKSSGQHEEGSASGESSCPEGRSENTETGVENGIVARSKGKRGGQLIEDLVSDKSICPEEFFESNETPLIEDGAAARARRKKRVQLIEDSVTDPGVQFICGLSDVDAIIGESAELTCKLNSEDCEGVWFRDGKKISPDDNFMMTKDGSIHKLSIITCQYEHSGKYRFEADNRKTEAMINVKDPPRCDPEDLSAFTQPVRVKVGHNAIFKLHFLGHAPIKIQWYREGAELQNESNTKIDKSANDSCLLLSRCQRKDSGEIKIKLKNEHGSTEVITQLTVLNKPTSPLGPAEVTESSSTCIEFSWRPPKDDGGSPVTNYIMERQQVGRNTWKKIGELPGVPSYCDTDVEHGKKYCYRIQAMTAEGISDVMETEEIQAGTRAFPGSPDPPKVVSAFDDCINLSWAAPSNKGGSHILGYILEKRKKGSNLWNIVNAPDELIKEKKYAVKDVVAGIEYEFRIAAINLSGPGAYSDPSEFVFARDPKKPPGKVVGLKVTETSYSHFVLAWTKPEAKPGIQDEAKGYYVEIRQAECFDWSRCNTTPVITNSYGVKGLKSMDMYWVRVIATNDGGESDPEEMPNFILAMPSLVRPKFTNLKRKTFVVVKAGNSVRITMNFEASPQPEIMWLKDSAPVTRRVTVSNSDDTSQLLIPLSERCDSGIYSILLKNLAGQETFSTEVRVTDDPKPPGLVELEENVPGTVTVTWAPSPDERLDDRLHYTVSKLDSTKRTWSTVAERLFNNKFTVCNIMQGREYHFRVYAKNDMGVSAPSESPTWGMEKKKEKFSVSRPSRKDCDLRCAPTFIVPLKLHTAPKGYECYMSCAVKGNPKPRITWYRNHISINTDTNYYISDTCGVCSLLILHVGPKDMGKYTITAENDLGRTECSTTLSVRETEA
ncbi:uncharacterized protein ACBR49_002315 [Aulostomus maculatus]